MFASLKVQCDPEGRPLEPLSIKQSGGSHDDQAYTNNLWSGTQALGGVGSDDAPIEEENFEDFDDAQIAKAVKVKSKRVREEQERAISSVRNAVTAGLKGASKKSKKTMSGVDMSDELEVGDDVDLLGDLDF